MTVHLYLLIKVGFHLNGTSWDKHHLGPIFLPGNWFDSFPCPSQKPLINRCFFFFSAPLDNVSQTANTINNRFLAIIAD